MSDRARGFRDDAGAAIEHAARLRDENERLKAELAEQKEAGPHELDAAKERAARLEAENELLKAALEKGETPPPISRVPAMTFKMPLVGWVIVIAFGAGIAWAACQQMQKMPPIQTPVE